MPAPARFRAVEDALATITRKARDTALSPDDLEALDHLVAEAYGLSPQEFQELGGVFRRTCGNDDPVTRLQLQAGINA
jgi:hypothetical protein